MNDIKQILESVRDGKLNVEEALLKLKEQPFLDLGYAKVDLHRDIRQGAGEVIYGASKTAEQITGIVKALISSGRKRVLITRIDAEKAAD
ncbi:MAG: 1-(5-phosphoribosyl)-5-amino-4-imidazole-carboxylate carboxylase, partial [Clostridia bacterium]|nr:1-(5-phosphoribosyl)-5-amino-4-imidazole-carboxylate carboxylase [Clostridia bacterium]